jgi:hypothetical protein
MGLDRSGRELRSTTGICEDVERTETRGQIERHFRTFARSNGCEGRIEKVSSLYGGILIGVREKCKKGGVSKMCG